MRVRIIASTAFALALAGCGSFSPERSASVRVTTAKGRVLYINRLARGVSYDVMWISTDDGRCREPSSQRDVILTGLDGYPLDYKLMPDGAVLLFLQVPAQVPEQFPVVIRQEEVHPLDWQVIEARRSREHIQRLEVKLPNSDDCLVRW